jgi:hypothetical protein
VQSQGGTCRPTASAAGIAIKDQNVKFGEAGIAVEGTQQTDRDFVFGTFVFDTSRDFVFGTFVFDTDETGTDSSGDKMYSKFTLANKGTQSKAK